MTDDPRCQLQDLEAEILRVQALLDKLVQCRVPIKRSINRYYSPMLALPIEICSEIFTACFPPASSDSPLLLGKICASWRNLAWSMPWLWNNISFSATRPNDVHVQLLEEWIVRSANFPLTLNINIGHFENTHIMDVLARCSKRWRTVHFDVPYFYPTDPTMSNVIPSHFPLLTSASVQVKFVVTPMCMFSTAPLLRDVQLGGFERYSFDVPWQTITSLRLCPTTIQQCLQVLSAAHNLTHCVFEGIIRSDVVDPFPIVARNLQYLEIINCTSVPVSELLDTICMPDAQELVFYVTGNTFPHGSFTSLMTRSKCTLHRLTLNAVRLLEWQLFECLLATPSLEALCLVDVQCVSHNTIWQFNPKSPYPNEPILPALTELTYVGKLRLDPRDLADLAHTRWRDRGRYGVMKTRTLASRTTEPLSTVEHKQLWRIWQMQEEGLRFALNTAGWSVEEIHAMAPTAS